MEYSARNQSRSSAIAAAVVVVVIADDVVVVALDAVESRRVVAAFVG